jgi:hypothetical protein
MSRIIAFTVLVIVLGLASYITFNAKYIRTRTIVEIRKDAIVVRGEPPYKPAYVLPLEEKSRFYDLKGNKTTLSSLKPGDRVKIKLFPRSYGRIFLVRKQRTVKWVKVLSEK